ncbi:5-(carboxyamino)imidazole ribonucleotide mutase [Candidiatus Paracoxiella cheracis]|uniref:5-(carboxyamino)imidazole ribonucleotide mutase n=1 Tax=Candidiatus Paracoxiella cheracis TaxID=3405120 RepID=UPI003BF4CD0C
MSKRFVAILMGSDSDLSTMETAVEQLKSLDIPFEAKILSAHRTPEATTHYVEDAEKRGCAVFIAAAGMAAHLAGCVAAHTLKPVIGVPIDSGPLKGHDALLSTVQMPGGVPVACVSIGKAGAKNAAILAAQILAVTDSTITQKLAQQRAKKRESLKAADANLQSKL